MGCCPEVKKEEWDRKSFEWTDKPFYRQEYVSLFAIPLNSKEALRSALERLKENLPGKPLIMTEHGLFRGSHYIELISDEQANHLESGSFFSMHFEGSTKSLPMWHRIIKEVSGSQKARVLPYYVTCPHCLDEKKQTVLIAKLE